MKVPNNPYGLCGRKACESRGGRPGLPVSNNPYGLCGRKAKLNLNLALTRGGDSSVVRAPDS